MSTRNIALFSIAAFVLVLALFGFKFEFSTNPWHIFFSIGGWW